MKLVLTAYFFGHLGPELSAVQLPFNSLWLKATHNSYMAEGQCEGRAECGLSLVCDFDSPWMNHPPNLQIEDFGAWGIELDYSIVNGQARVGHDTDHDEATYWGGGDNLLTNYFMMVRTNRAFDYRPTIIYLEKKAWGSCGLGDPQCYFPIVEAGLLAVFGPEHLFGPTNLAAFWINNQRYPTVPELAGKVLPVAISDECGDDMIFNDIPNHAVDRCPGAPWWRTLNIRTMVADKCTDSASVEAFLTSESGGKLVRADQYQADWTFLYAVPPNPLVVDSGARKTTMVNDSVGDHWCCGNDVSHGQIVGQHGTFRFPYSTLAAAVNRARGIVPGNVTDLSRSGYGWTVLLSPGNYTEPLTINIPLRLKASSGTVTIGR